MLGNSSFGFSGDGTGGVSPITGGGTLNYIAKFTPSGTVIGDSLFFDNGVSAGLGTATPSASALLEISSTTQGLLTPRMTTAQRDAIPSPATGLFIYNLTTSFFNYWDGVAWIQVDSSTGGDVSGSGTTNYATMWTDGANSVLGDAPIKIGNTITRAMPTTGVGANNSIAVGFDTTLNSFDSYTLGRGITVSSGVGAYIIGHSVNIDDIGDPFSSGGNFFSLGSLFNVTGGANCDAIINLSFSSSITATAQTRGVYLFGDSHIITDFVTYSTLIGESCNFTRVDHSTAIGIFTNITDSEFIYTYGEGTSIDNSNTVINFGSYNSISGSTNLSVFGSGNTITDSNKLYIGNNNNNIVVDGITGDVGIGVVNPLAKFHNFGVNASGVNQTLEPVLNVTEKVSGNTVNTTDATVTTIQTIAIPTDKVLMIETRVTARKTAGAGVGTVNDGNGYVRTATFANIAGVVTLSGAVQTSYTGEGIAAFNVTLVISGTDVLIRVTGAANDDVTWNSITRTYEV